MTHFTTALLSLLLCLTLLNIAITRQAVRPVSSCEWQTLADLRSLPPLKGSIVEPEPISPEEFNASFDFRTE